MTPRMDIVWLDIDEPLHKLQQKIIDSVYSRFLVCQGSIDNPLGFLGSKEFLAACLASPSFDLTTLLTPLSYIPESTPALNCIKFITIAVATEVKERSGSLPPLW